MKKVEVNALMQEMSLQEMQNVNGGYWPVVKWAAELIASTIVAGYLDNPSGCNSAFSGGYAKGMSQF